MSNSKSSSVRFSSAFILLSREEASVHCGAGAVIDLTRSERNHSAGPPSLRGILIKGKNVFAYGKALGYIQIYDASGRGSRTTPYDEIMNGNVLVQ